MKEGLNIIEDMKKLGLSEYEIKAYLKLLEEYPLNGYALSKNSGIPRSRIYEILENLKNKQMVFEETNEKSTVYYPLEPKLLLNKLRYDFENIIENVETYANELYNKEKENNKLVVIKGRKNIIDFINVIVKSAKKRITVSIWEEEIEGLKDGLNEAIARGVDVKGIYFGKNNPFKSVMTHRRIERYLAEKEERYMTVVVDRKDSISGIISKGEQSQVTWTKDSGFIDMSEDYIAHDLMVNKLALRLNEEELKEFELYMDEVRKEFFDFSDEEFEEFNKKG
ncbi:MAG: hypothetical protein N4A54_08430 [Peptostreptococcaceae bacterium]|jgi:sugar-specific transcriptional regulator TrmB|nr:hypothetical protein [Peptostreptococcaceae bacterium]